LEEELVFYQPNNECSFFSEEKAGKICIIYPNFLDRQGFWCRKTEGSLIREVMPGLAPAEPNTHSTM
jgi:hypothetical protein